MAGDDDSGSRSATTPATSDDDGRRKKVIRVVAADDIDEEDELFELDIALLDGRNCSAPAGADDDQAAAGQQHALLGNCLLPVRSLSSAVPVDATRELSSTTTAYPYYSGYHSSRRFTGGGIGRRFLLGWLAGHGNSARFRFSSRGFEAYFQRY
ncbi:hypothetical protein HU200_030303 [Digitaria exilis]|uniref:Uncharacterized protein n=1 Tax=Digitaria exilis TaxID=1010633 RepID=A0A835BRC3_9POAL|nr:hypothetical protein HU200_030303 [Digitaria exilis]